MNIRKYVDLFANLALPAKFLISTFVASLAGGGIITFLIQNAAYNYALTYGFRPPFESIPYILPIVTFTSVFLLLFGFLLTAIVIASAKAITSGAIRNDKSYDEFISDIRSMRARYAIPTILILSIISAALKVYILPSLFGVQKQTCMWPLILCASDGGVGLDSAMISFCVSVIFLIIVWRPGFTVFGVFILVGSYYSWIGSAVLPAEGYARLLRTIGFGGGTLVSLEISTTESNTTKKDSYLLIRTSDHIIVYEDDIKQIQEYPTSKISRITHNVGGLQKLPYLLPERSNYLQYFDNK